MARVAADEGWPSTCGSFALLSCTKASVWSASACCFCSVPIQASSDFTSAAHLSMSSWGFTFFGFLARKGGERAQALAEVAALRHLAVLYEAPGRVADIRPYLYGMTSTGAAERATKASFFPA